MVNPKRKRKFLRQSTISYKRLKRKWIKPRGGQGKMRRKEKGRSGMPSIGYGAPKQLRYLHPSGLKEVLIYNVTDLQKVNPKIEAAKISHSLGKRKRQEIVKKAEELKVKVLNP